MSVRVELSHGQWADLRDSADVTTRARRPIEKALMAISQGSAKDALIGTEDLSDEAKAEKVAATLDLNIIDQFNDLNDLLALARIEAWSFGVPITLDSLLDLPDADYKALQKIVAKEIMSMLPNFGESDDKDSPTKPLNV